MTWKMKLVSLGIVPDHIGFTADRYWAEMIPLSYWRYRSTDYFIM